MDKAVKSVKTAIGRLFVAIALIVGIGALCAATVQQAHAAALEAGSQADGTTMTAQAVKDLQKRGVKFDLKKNKVVRFKVAHAALQKTTSTRYSKVKQPFAAKVTDLMVGRATKKGYKVAMLTIKFSSTWKPSARVAKQVWNAGYGVESSVSYTGAFGDFYVFVVDGKTGINLMGKNPYGVSAVIEWGKGTSTKKYYFDKKHTNWVNFCTGNTAKVTIAFPSKYKNLCIGVGGTLWTTGDDYNTEKTYVTGSDWKFIGTGGTAYPFTKTTYFTKSKSNLHFMRLK